MSWPLPPSPTHCSPISHLHSAPQKHMLLLTASEIGWVRRRGFESCHRFTAEEMEPPRPQAGPGQGCAQITQSPHSERRTRGHGRMPNLAPPCIFACGPSNLSKTGVSSLPCLNHHSLCSLLLALSFQFSRVFPGGAHTAPLVEQMHPVLFH